MLKSCLKKLESHRLRRTATRTAILEILHAATSPLSPPAIVERCHEAGRRANKTTIYRDLEAMEQAGIVHRVMVSDRSQYFELTERGEHHHVVCVACDKVEDIVLDDDPAFIKRWERAAADKGFSVLQSSTRFLGTCKQCT